jgi:hypothetical protein
MRRTGSALSSRSAVPKRSSKADFFDCQEEIEAKVTILTEKINELVTQAEGAGTSGEIEEAQGLLKLCDTLKGEREELKNQIGMKQHKLPPGFGGDGRHGENRQMEVGDSLQQRFSIPARQVCEVCGAFVNFWVGAGGENQSRVDDHLMGKQHIGYARLRATVETLGNEVQRLKDLVEEKEATTETVFQRNARLATTPRAIEAEKEETAKTKKSRSRSKESRKSSSKRRSRSRSKGSRRRSRSSERRSKRDRSRSRDRRRGRDRSRDRKSSRERRREKSREKSRERRREKSRERRRAGRSKSRSRSRS